MANDGGATEGAGLTPQGAFCRTALPPLPSLRYRQRWRNCQKATALAAATLSESTSCFMGMRTV